MESKRRLKKLLRETRSALYDVLSLPFHANPRLSLHRIRQAFNEYEGELIRTHGIDVRLLKTLKDMGYVLEFKETELREYLELYSDLRAMQRLAEDIGQHGGQKEFRSPGDD